MRDAAAGRSAGHRSHLQRRASTTPPAWRACSKLAQALARARTRPRRSIYIAVHDGRGVGAARRRVLRRAPGAAGRRVGREHQHRRPEFCGPRARHRAARRRALDARRDGRGARAERTAASSGPIPNRAAAISSAPITFRSRRSASRRCRSASRPSYIGKDPAFAKKLRDEYNEKDYHQPSDEFKADWDYSRRRRRHAASRRARLADRQRPDDAGLPPERAVRAAARDGATR